jgi:IS30 family transposase
MTYTHLTPEERNYIETRHKLNESTLTIACALGHNQSTISRELRRNRGQRGYRHKQAHGKAQQRHADKRKASVCHETIYQHVLKNKRAGGKLYLNLRRHEKKYRKRYGSSTGSVKGIPNRVDIDERPDEANQRIRLSDWEADTMIGKGHKGALVTLSYA